MKEQPETESLAQVGPDGFALPIRKRNFLSEWFENPFKSWTGVPTFGQILKWKFTETNEENVPDQATLDKTIPVHNLTKFEANSSFYATWLGHATVLVHMEGANFITDPIWAERASPMSFAGPARYRPPPMKIEDLPKIDFGVISHDHYDHLDEQSVKTITAQNPSIHWFVPLKIKKWMRDAGIQAEITEMNWGDNETVEIGGNSFTIWCLPAQHWGQRSAIDRNRRLWSGWSVHGPTKKFFYTGDTGYCEEEFVKIGQKFGPFDLAAIPIGAYAPRWFMKNQHIDPEEAFKIHQHVKSKRSIGIHWGTYHMGSYEFYLEPKERLDKLMEENEGDPFTTIEMGTIWQEDEATETSGSSSTSQL